MGDDGDFVNEVSVFYENLLHYSKGWEGTLITEVRMLRHYFWLI